MRWKNCHPSRERVSERTRKYPQAEVTIHRDDVINVNENLDLCLYLPDVLDKEALVRKNDKYFNVTAMTIYCQRIRIVS